MGDSEGGVVKKKPRKYLCIVHGTLGNNPCPVCEALKRLAKNPRVKITKGLPA